MAALVDRKYLGKTFNNEKETLIVRYDFSKDGGATGALDIFEATADVILVGFYSYVKTACTSDGSATLKVGVTGADSAFMTTTEGAVASLTVNTVIQAKPVLSEGTPNTVAWPFPRKLASGEKVLQTIGTAAMTAGVIEYVIEYIRA